MNRRYVGGWWVSGSNLDKGLDGPFGDVQERRPATHIGALAHGRRGVDEEHYDGHIVGGSRATEYSKTVGVVAPRAVWHVFLNRNGCGTGAAVERATRR